MHACCLRLLALHTVPGFPAYMYQQATRMLDTACIHAAACDMAIADAGFRAAASPSNLSMMTALCGIFERAEAEFPKGREAAGLLALMDFQFGRLALSTVRSTVSCRHFSPWPPGLYCWWVAAGVQGHAEICAAAAPG